MRISAVHSTVYRYDSPVFLEPHTFRLQPRQDASQRLGRYSIEIDPAPAGMSECLDQDGNVVLETWFHGPHQQLAAKSSFEIETLRENPFDFMLASPRFGSLPLLYEEPLHAALAPHRGTGTEPEAIREMARQVAGQSGGKTLDFLTALNQAIFEDFEHTIRAEGPPLEPEETLRARAGTCRDLAMLYCTACRTLGIPARFVSGYEREAAIQEQANMHAWAEVYLAGGGWRGYDPSQGLAVSTSHVAIAAAADPRLAAPVTGTYRGSARSQMEFSISMLVEER